MSRAALGLDTDSSFAPTPPHSGRSSPYPGLHNASSDTASFSGTRFADDLEGQNDEAIEGLSAKVKLLKEVRQSHPPRRPTTPLPPSPPPLTTHIHARMHARHALHLPLGSLERCVGVVSSHLLASTSDEMGWLTYTPFFCFCLGNSYVLRLRSGLGMKCAIQPSSSLKWCVFNHIFSLVYVRMGV